ncbi:MAG TPA: M23 family metallopeptidase [Blastocatellia bacterium]|nr:M23 family metallopeptidase [Blastocatellia bacterium]
MRTLIVFVLLILFVALLGNVYHSAQQFGHRPTADTNIPAEKEPVTTHYRNQPASTESSSEISAPSGLIIPVAGITPDKLHDTFNEARSEGRVHDALDIMAPHDAPVLAATGGTIIKLFQSERGGTTIYQRDPDGKTIYYYAHLDHYAEGLSEGHYAKQGEVIGYVGDTGNAGPGNYHLHFAIWIAPDEKHFWNGTNVNPYPILHNTH